MNRRAALWGSGVLTALVLLSIFLLVKRADADPAQAATSDLSALVADEQSNASAPALTTIYQQREAALQAQVATGKALLQSLDETYQPQLAQLEDELTQLEHDVAQRTQHIAAIQEGATAIQKTLAEPDQRYQQQLAALQQRDSAGQQQVAAILAALQAASAQIDARRSGAAPDNNGENEYGENELGHEHDDD